jgi:tRNA:m4X modification enzyme
MCREVASLVLAAVASLPAVPAPAMIPDCVSAAAARLEETARDVHTTDPWDEKHSAQHIGILSAMHTHGLLHSGDGTVFAELGAGRGYLLNALAVCVGPPCRLLFVERKAYRNKAERSLRRRPGIEVARARCDVADLDLEQAIATLFDGAPERAPDTVIVLAKHLCGSATDMALRCAIRCARAGNCKLGGLAMAPCCHHACSWTAFVNKDFLKVHGIGRRQFSILKRLASWCVDSHGGGRAPSTEADEGDRLSRWGFPPSERARIGTAVKRFLDTGRAEWLTQQRGGPAASEASLVSYVDAGITPENRLVVWRCCHRATE